MELNKEEKDALRNLINWDISEQEKLIPIMGMDGIKNIAIMRDIEKKLI